MSPAGGPRRVESVFYSKLTAIISTFDQKSLEQGMSLTTIPCGLQLGHMESHSVYNIK